MTRYRRSHYVVIVGQGQSARWCGHTHTTFDAASKCASSLRRRLQVAGVFIAAAIS